MITVPLGIRLLPFWSMMRHGGDLKLNEDGSFAYAPHGGFSGNDSFTYRAIDKSASGSTAADGAVATVSIFVQALHPPVYATDDTYHTPAGTPLKIDDPGVLGNDSLFRSPPLMGPGGEGEWSIVPNPPISPVPSNVKLTAKLVDQPAHGKLTLSETGGFSYTPDPDFTGPIRSPTKPPRRSFPIQPPAAGARRLPYQQFLGRRSRSPACRAFSGGTEQRTAHHFPAMTTLRRSRSMSKHRSPRRGRWLQTTTSQPRKIRRLTSRNRAFWPTTMSVCRIPGLRREWSRRWR